MKQEYRSLGYMRALAIWGMQWALEKYHVNIFKNRPADLTVDA